MSYNCPKTFPVEGLSSVAFMATIQSILESPNDDRLFIDAILSDLMDCFGDDFNLSIYPLKYSPKYYHIVIRYKEYKWLAEFACKLDEFQQKLKSMLKVLNVGIYAGQGKENSAYSFVAKKGIYEELHR